MSATKHGNFVILPAGAVDWISVYNALQAQIERDPPTVFLTTAAALAIGYPFYVNSSGLAAKATNATDCNGIWLSTTTGLGAQGFGQRGGIFTKAGWTWSPGGIVYVNSSGALTQTPDNYSVGIAISATEIFLLIIPKDVADAVSKKHSASDQLDGREQQITCADNVTIDWRNGATAYMVFDRATVAFTLAGGVNGKVYRLRLTQDGSGRRLATWVTTIHWAGESAPTLTIAINRSDWITLVYSNGAWYGDCRLDFY
jgi:hypothetical protein